MSPYLRRYLMSLGIAIALFVVIVCAVMIGMPMPRLGRHEHWYADPLTWLLVGTATIAVGLVQRRRRRAP
jgi:hypothetical protein